MFRNKNFNFGWSLSNIFNFLMVICISPFRASPLIKSNAIFSQYNKKLSVPMLYKFAGDKAEECESGDVVLKIMGMASSKCEDAIKAAVLKCDGVKDARVSHKEGEAIIKVNIFEVDVNELKEVVENSGFSVGAIHFNTEI